jgi:Glycosyltransferase WbsX
VKTIFIAYVYPGWHTSPHRPGTDEWELLDHFEPYFQGHIPPPRPIGSFYDDSLSETVCAQVALAEQYGISVFDYFLYYRHSEFILAAPLMNALGAAEMQRQLGVAATWCIRSPIPTFPIPASTTAFDGVLDDCNISYDDVALAPDEKPLESLTPSDLKKLLDGDV